jgi:hypothetical protein
VENIKNLSMKISRQITTFAMVSILLSPLDMLVFYFWNQTAWSTSDMPTFTLWNLEKHFLINMSSQSLICKRTENIISILSDILWGLNARKAQTEMNGLRSCLLEKKPRNTLGFCDVYLEKQG